MTHKQRLTVTREAPIRGSVKDYQDWLIEQLKAGVDPYFTGADINDCSWARRVIEIEEQHDRTKTALRETDTWLASLVGRGHRLRHMVETALADKPPEVR